MGRAGMLVRGRKFLDSPVGKALLRELAEHGTDSTQIARRMKGLEAFGDAASALTAQRRRLEAALGALPEAGRHRAQSRRAALDHLYDTAAVAAQAPPDTLRERHLRDLAHLRRVIDEPLGRELLHSPAGRRVLEEQAQQLFDNLAGTYDQYERLEIETGAFNAIVKALYPDDYASLRIDAHHMIESRTYAKFADTWRLLGWQRAEQLPALPVLYEFHIRSPKRLDGIKDLAAKGNVTSLTRELLDTIKLDQIGSIDELLAAYKRYYAKTALDRDALRLIDDVERRLANLRSRQKAFREAKKRSGVIP